MARPAKKPGAPALRLILDSGAVLALARHDVRARAALAAAWEAGAEVVLPAVVVAETVRGNGPRGAAVNRVVAAAGDVAELDEATARLAGVLLARAGSSATVDALVVAEAVARGGGVILTGDADDLRRLAGPHQRVLVQAI
ncbi:MAG TPA: PIN domain-containing protein [Acidimicrobiales bacterium]|nr:PIN domain-containing protein [Acidimicrobiales bacterium]